MLNRHDAGLVRRHAGRKKHVGFARGAAQRRGLRRSKVQRAEHRQIDQQCDELGLRVRRLRCIRNRVAGGRPGDRNGDVGAADRIARRVGIGIVDMRGGVQIEVGFGPCRAR